MHICDICDGVYFFAIFHFWRRKFDDDPVVDSKVKWNLEVLNMFTRIYKVQNRIHLK